MRDRESMRFTTPSDISGELGVRRGDVGNRVLRSRAGLVGVRILDGVLDVEHTSGSVILLRIGLVALGGDKCDVRIDVEGDVGGTISTSILGRFRGGGVSFSRSGASARGRREFLRPYVRFIVVVV